MFTSYFVFFVVCYRPSGRAPLHLTCRRRSGEAAQVRRTLESRRVDRLFATRLRMLLLYFVQYYVQSIISVKFWDTAHGLGEATPWLTNRNSRADGKIMQASCMGGTKAHQSLNNPFSQDPGIVLRPAIWRLRR